MGLSSSYKAPPKPPKVEPIIQPRQWVIDLARAMPSWLEPVAIWLVERETKRAEAILKRLGDAIAAFAMAAKVAHVTKAAIKLQVEMHEAQMRMMRDLARQSPSQQANMFNAYQQQSPMAQFGLSSGLGQSFENLLYGNNRLF